MPCTDDVLLSQAAEARHAGVITALKEGWAAELKRQREAWCAAERVKREAWSEAKTAEIKALTVKVGAHWDKRGGQGPVGWLAK